MDFRNFRQWDDPEELAERPVRTLFDRMSDLMVPPQVEIVPYRDPVTGFGQALRYSLPVDLETPVPMHQARRLALIEREKLYALGWRDVIETDGVLTDFLRLARGTAEDVADFARQWGPLWLCREHANCAVERLGRGTECVWPALEPIAAWWREAQYAKGVVEIATRLNANAAPYESWEALGIERELFRAMKIAGNRSEQVFWLAALVQMKLDGPWTPMIRLHGHVGPDSDDPARYTMFLDTGPGFLNAVWHEVALWLCRLDEVYVCDGCGQPYQRGIRKPRQDQDNFCPACRQGNRASKRLWAQRNRAKRKEQAPDQEEP